MENNIDIDILYPGCEIINKLMTKYFHSRKI